LSLLEIPISYFTKGVRSELRKRTRNFPPFFLEGQQLLIYSQEPSLHWPMTRFQSSALLAKGPAGGTGLEASLRSKPGGGAAASQEARAYARAMGLGMGGALMPRFARRAHCAEP